jgi:hypothetical protein
MGHVNATCVYRTYSSEADNETRTAVLDSDSVMGRVHNYLPMVRQTIIGANHGKQSYRTDGDDGTIGRKDPL